MTIGQVARKAQRAADAGKMRPRRIPTHDTEGLPEVGGATQCVSCRTRMPEADAMYSAAGPLCPPCHHEHEADASTPSILREMIPVALSTLVLAGIAYLLSWTPGTQVVPFGEAGVIVTASVALCASAVLTLQWFRFARDAFHPSLHEDESRTTRTLRGVLSIVAGVSAAVVGLGAVVFAAL